MILAAFIVAGLPRRDAVRAGRCCAAARTRYRARRLRSFRSSSRCAVVPLQIVVGDWAARHVAVHQPVKLAAMEGLTHTQQGAPLHIGGIYIDGEVRVGIEIPDGLSFLAFHRIRTRSCRGSSRCRPPTVRRSTWCASRSRSWSRSAPRCSGSALWLLLAWRRRRDLPRSRWFLPLRARWPARRRSSRSSAGGSRPRSAASRGSSTRVMRTRDAVSDASGLRYGYFLLLVRLRRAHDRDGHRVAAAVATDAAGGATRDARDRCVAVGDVRRHHALRAARPAPTSAAGSGISSRGERSAARRRAT